MPKKRKPSSRKKKPAKQGKVPAFIPPPKQATEKRGGRVFGGIVKVVTLASVAWSSQQSGLAGY